MKNRQLTFEQALYILIFLLALGVRLVNLGAIPLSDFEAGWALRAWDVSQGGQAAPGPQPGYVLLTGLTFFLFGSSDALARLWPAIMGSAMAILPFLFRERLGRRAALVFALGLALDPGFVALSRLAGGPVLAVSFSLLAIGAWLASSPIVAGILAGFALLSGPAVLAGLLGLGVAWGLGRMLGIFDHDGGPNRGDQPRNPAGAAAVRAALTSGGGTIFLAGTLFLRFPQGLGGLASAFPAYIEGWLIPSGTPPSQLLFTLIAYQPFALVFGLIAVGRVWLRGNDRQGSVGRALSIWFLAALALSLLYPARQAGDLIWALGPLWGLAGLEIARFLRKNPDPGTGEFIPLGLAALVVVLFGSIWVNLAGLAITQPDDKAFVLRLLIIVGAVILGLLSTVLVALGWSPDEAMRGLVWGTVVSMGIGLLTGIWGAMPKESTDRLGLWTPAPGPGQSDLLSSTLGDLSDWSSGRRDSLDVVVLVNVPSMRWTLRDLPYVRFQDSLGTGNLPSAIITHENDVELNLASAYRGQDFVWWVHPSWDRITSMDLLQWLFFREAPTAPEQVIVWGRSDLFPSGMLSVEADREIEVAPQDSGESDFIPEEEILDKEVPVK